MAFGKKNNRSRRSPPVKPSRLSTPRQHVSYIIDNCLHPVNHSYEELLTALYHEVSVRYFEFYQDEEKNEMDEET